MRPLAPAGSILWLLRHELRLSLRAPRAQRSRRLLLAFMIGLGMLSIGAPMALLTRRLQLSLTPEFALFADLGLLAMFNIMASQSLIGAGVVFEQRGDLDLLLSSPLPPRKLLAARALGVAVAPFLGGCLLATPVVLPLILAGRVGLLGVYPTLAAMALVAAAAGIGLTVILSLAIGAKAARILGQILAGVVGVGFLAMSRAGFLSRRVMRSAGHAAQAWIDAGAFSHGSPLSAPPRALLGDVLAWGPLIVLAAAVFAATVWALGPSFARLATVSPKARRPSPARRSARAERRAFGRRGVQGLVRKELRLLLRDPELLYQLLMRVLSFAPLIFILSRSAAQGGYGTAYAAGVISLLASQLAGNLAWITVCAEDAPDLIASSPMDGAFIRRAKLLAALLPALAVAAAPLLALAVLSPAAGAVGAAATVVSCVCAGLINLWYEKPAPRKGLRGRRQGQIVVALAELIVSAGWSVTAVLALRSPLWALVPGVLTLMVLGALKVLAEPAR